MKTNAKKPNFYIIGAPKCGTTSLSEYLRTHPDVFFCEPKEPFYFNTDYGSRHRKVRTEAEYLALFDGAGKYPAVGEGSVFYLFSKEAVPSILKFNPEARFIVMLRNPLEQFVSWYWQLVRGRQEDARNPEKAWRLQNVRMRGEWIPVRCGDAQHLHYGKVCKLGEQLQRLYASASRQRVLVIFFDDFKADPLAVYRNTLEFLGLADDGRIEFPVMNSRSLPRYRTLMQSVEKLGKIKRALGVHKTFGLGDMIRRQPPKDVKPVPLREEFRKELIAFFAQDIQELSRLTGRDLSAWSA